VTDRRPGAPGRIRVRAVVAGRVQGVWYRESCRAQAERLGVGGWVHNNADGTVVIEAEGERAAVEALLAWARQGPPRAQVESVSVADLPPQGQSAFSVGR
jgi:acylphosphatase